MPSILVSSINGGLDVRRLPETTPGGVLIKATDGHMNRGGEFEKRSAFVPTYALPANATESMAATAAGVYVFGTASTPAGIPVGVTYQQVANGGKTLDRILSWDLFKGEIFAIARYTDLSISGFYNGVLDTDMPANSTFFQTIGTKGNTVAGPLLNHSVVSDPTTWSSGTGAGFEDLSQYLSGAENLLALSDYQNFTAIFATRTIQIWSLDADPGNNARQQTLRNTGTTSPRSVLGYGDGDVFYLDESGLRSLAARVGSTSAATSGIGVKVDPLIIAKLRSLTDDERSKVIALIEPQDGRFWLIMKDTIFVLTYFPEEKISAWSTYTTTYYDTNGVLQNFTVDDACVFNRRVYIRSGDEIFVYGGIATGLVTDATVAEAWMPYLDGSDPTKFKKWRAFDAAISGEWDVAAGMSLRDNTVEDAVCTIYRSTYNEESIGTIGDSTHISLRFRSRGTGAAILSACAIHYEE